MSTESGQHSDLKPDTPLYRLLQTLVRLFYEPRECVAMELFLNHRVMSEKDLAERMCLTYKDAGKAIGILKSDHLIGEEVITRIEKVERNEMEESRTLVSGYYYIDCASAIDAIKAKLHGIRAGLERQSGEHASGTMLKCPACERRYTCLEAYLSPQSNAFECLHCSGAELVEEEPVNNSQSTQDGHLMRPFMECTRPILDLLKQCDTMRIPTFSVRKWLESEAKKEEMQEEEGEVAVEHKKPEIRVDIADATKHELPSWLAKSTVTGESIFKEKTEDIKPPPQQIGEDTFSYDESPEIKESVVVKKRDEPSVYGNIILTLVAGELKPLSEVTAQDQEKMSGEEYMAYYEALEMHSNN